MIEGNANDETSNQVCFPQGCATRGAIVVWKSCLYKTETRLLVVQYRNPNAVGTKPKLGARNPKAFARMIERVALASLRRKKAGSHSTICLCRIECGIRSDSNYMLRSLEGGLRDPGLCIAVTYLKICK